MRLDALELVRYGHFDGRTLEFRKSGTAGCESDLQIVHGPNEAGKSTIREAISDLLFRVPPRSRMTFAVRDVLKVGARATVARVPVEAYRLKKNKDDLVDAQDRPLGDNPFAVVTDGFDRDSFEQTFSVNRDQLESGGEMILKGEGDLGQLLFAGTSGLQGLPEKLTGLDDRASAIWSRKSGASARVLVDEIREIDQRIRQLQTTQSVYDGKRRDVDRLAAAFEKARHDHAVVEAGIRRVSGRLNALRPHRDRLRALNELEELGTGEVAGEDDRERLSRVVNELAALDARSNAAAEKKAALEHRRAALPEADQIVGHREAIEELEKLAGHIRKERADRPNREREAEEAGDTTARVLRELDIEPAGDTTGLALPPGAGRALSDLLKRRAELSASLAAAEQEARNAREKLDEAGRALKALPEAGDPGTLRAVLKATRARDLVSEQRDASRAIAGHREEIVLAMQSIGLVPDRAGWLGGLDLPDAAVVERLEDRLRKAGEALARLEVESAQAAAAATAAEDHLKSLGDAVVLSDAALGAARAARDEAVRALRGDLSADRVENLRERLAASIADADRIFEERIRNADRLGEMNAAVRSGERARLAVERITGELDIARQALEAVRNEVSSFVPDGVAVSGPAGLRALVAARANVRSALARIDTCDQELQEIASTASGWAGELRRSLAGAGRTVDADASLPVVQNLAEEWIATLEARGRERAAAEARMAEAEQDLGRRSAKLTRLTSDLAGWDADFAGAVAGTWIPADTGPAQVGEILARLPELTEARANLKTAQRRLERMDEDAGTMARRLETFLEAAGTGVPDDLAEAEPVMVIDHLKARLERAGERDRQATVLAGQVEDLDAEIAGLGRQIAEKRSEVADLVDRFGEPSFSELPSRIRDGVKRRELREQLAALDRSIVEALGVTAIDEALDLMNDADEDALRDELTGLEANRDRLNRERDETGRAHAVVHAEFAKMTGSDGIARLLQQREILKAELVDQVQDYMGVRAGERALNWALTRYRQANKAPMLEAAGRFFARMTGGRYPELITQPGDKGDVLVARENAGTLKTVDALSEGTRHQLFLALRMAGYLELARGRQAPPLILDDILSSSDEKRAGAMLEALADLAGEVQVIVLTHHEFVLEIARQTVEGRHAVISLEPAA